MQIKAFPSARRARVEMVPLIDMFFLLLVFFIYGVFSLTAQQGILVDLPAAATGAAARRDTVTLSLDAEGRLFFNQEPLTVDQLPLRLEALRREQADPLVLINADQAARHGVVIQILDLVRQAQIRRVSFQTRQAP